MLKAQKKHHAQLLNGVTLMAIVFMSLCSTTDGLLRSCLVMQAKGFGGGGGGAVANHDNGQKQKLEKKKTIAPPLGTRTPAITPVMGNRLPIDLQYPNLRCISADPPVFEVPNFFTNEECDRYIDSISKGVEIQSQTYSAESTRTSTTWYMPYVAVPELLYKAKKLSRVPIEQFEEPQIVRYEIGQQFSWHYDAIPASKNNNGGNRLATLIVYLNTVNGSGATVFKTLGPLQVKAEKGKALLFFPCTLDGKSDDATMHAGQVCMDTKWIAQM